MAKTTNSANLDKILGKGINFPIMFSSNNHTELLETSSGTDVINQSIHLILHTRLGERYNSQEFGTSIAELLFSQNDLILRDLLYYSISTAISRWEKRVTILEILFATSTYGSNPDPTNPIDDHTVLVTVNYMINSTHTKGSYVFPFVTNTMPMSETITGVKTFNLTSQSYSR